MSVQTELTRITNAKAAIKTAIEGKGVTVPDGTLLNGMAALIESIEVGGGGDIIVGTFTPVEDANNIELPGVIYTNEQYLLAIFYDGKSGTVTSGHFRIGMDINITRVARYYSSTVDKYSPQLGNGNIITINGANFQAGITYRYIFVKKLW